MMCREEIKQKVIAVLAEHGECTPENIENAMCSKIYGLFLGGMWGGGGEKGGGGDESRLLFIWNLPKTTNLQERFLITRMGASKLYAERIRTRNNSGCR